MSLLVTRPRGLSFDGPWLTAGLGLCVTFGGCAFRESDAASDSAASTVDGDDGSDPFDDDPPGPASSSTGGPSDSGSTGSGAPHKPDTPETTQATSEGSPPGGTGGTDAPSTDDPQPGTGADGSASKPFVLAPCFGEAALRFLDEEDDLFPNEWHARLAFLQAPIRVEGTVVDAHGTPLANARVAVEGCDLAVESDADGRFVIDAIGRHNQALRVTAEGHKTTLAHVHLARPLAVDAVAMDPIVLSALGPQAVRLTFGGDTTFGRRFMDPAEVTTAGQLPSDDPNALILASDPLPGAQKVVAQVAPLLSASDFPVVHLESVVLSDPSTPHPTKESISFSLPAAMGALHGLGIRYVSLASDHAFDYLDSGVTQTKAALDAWSIGSSGTGSNADEAFRAYVTTLGGQPYAFFSMTSVSGAPSSPLNVATDTTGGSADLRDRTAVQAAIGTARTRGEVPIASLHGGKLYSRTPSGYAYDRMIDAAEAGAALVVGHHPHVAQGFSFAHGALLMHSLGDFAYDHERHESFLGLIAQVELQDGAFSSATAYPIHLEDYQPRSVVGRLADVFLRRIGEDSTRRDAFVYPQGNLGHIRSTTDSIDIQRRSTTIDMTVGDDGLAVLDLRSHLAPQESLVFVRIDAPGVLVKPGEDLLHYGDFEDMDVDQDLFETSRWDVSGTSRFVCLDGAFDGVASLCQVRSASHTEDSVVSLRNRVRFLGTELGSPVRELTVVGNVRGDNAGLAEIRVRYLAGQGDLEFGEEVVFSHPGGTYAWQTFSHTLTAPTDAFPGDDDENNARAVRLFLRHAPPTAVSGAFRTDNLALVSWREGVDPQFGHSMAGPNPVDFLAIEAAPGPYSVAVTFERWTTLPVAGP